MKKLESLKDDRFSKFETDKISNMINIKGGAEIHLTGNNSTNTCYDTAEWCDINVYNAQGQIIGTRRIEDNGMWYKLDEFGKKTTNPC